LWSWRLCLTARQEMPAECHGHFIPVADKLKFCGVILDRKLTWLSHIKAACTKKAKQLAAMMTSCARQGGPADVQGGGGAHHDAEWAGRVGSRPNKVGDG